MPLKVLTIQEEIADSVALVARKNIITPHDLEGTTILTQIGSIADFALGVIIDVFDIDPTLITKIDVQSFAQLETLWETNPNVSAVISWDPFRSYALTHGGHIIMTSSTLASWGKGIYHYIVARQDAISLVPKFFQTFLQVMFAVYADYNNNPQFWNDKLPSPYLDDILRLTGPQTNIFSSIAEMGYSTITLNNSITCITSGCGINEAMIPTVQYTCAFFFTGKVLPYCANIQHLNNTVDMEPLMAASSAFPLITMSSLTSMNRVFPSKGPDSFCSGAQVITTNTTFGDGHGINGTVLASLTCIFVLQPPDANNIVTTLEFDSLWLQSGYSFVYVYSGSNNINTGNNVIGSSSLGNSVILSSYINGLTMLYSITGVRIPPPISVTGPLTLMLSTGVNEDIFFPPNTQETGFVASVTYSAHGYCASDSDCSTNGICSYDSHNNVYMCICNSGWYGADCSVRDCSGRQVLTSEKEVITVLEYLNNAICTWTIIPASGKGILLTLHFLSICDVSFDTLKVYDGATGYTSGSPNLLAVLSGNSSTGMLPRELYAPSGVMTLMFTSDKIGHIGATWEASYETTSMICATDADCNGHGRCIRNTCVCDNNYWGPHCDVTACFGIKRLTTNSILATQTDTITNSTGYMNNANCSWIVPVPKSNTIRGRYMPMPVGIHLDFSTFDVEVGDSLSLYGIKVFDDAQGADGLSNSYFYHNNLYTDPIATFAGVSGSCVHGRDCQLNGRCVFSDIHDIKSGLCVCNPGYLNGDCSLPSSYDIADVQAVVIQFKSDINNARVRHGVLAQVKTLYGPIPVNIDFKYDVTYTLAGMMCLAALLAISILTIAILNHKAKEVQIKGVIVYCAKLVGVIFISIGMLCYLLSIGGCVLFYVLVVIGVMLVYSGHLIALWRLFRIFNNTKLRPVKVTKKAIATQLLTVNAVRIITLKLLIYMYILWEHMVIDEYS